MINQAFWGSPMTMETPKLTLRLAQDSSDRTGSWPFERMGRQVYTAFCDMSYNHGLKYKFQIRKSPKLWTDHPSCRMSRNWLSLYLQGIVQEQFEFLLGKLVTPWNQLSIHWAEGSPQVITHCDWIFQKHTPSIWGYSWVLPFMETRM